MAKKVMSAMMALLAVMFVLGGCDKQTHTVTTETTKTKTETIEGARPITQAPPPAVQVAPVVSPTAPTAPVVTTEAKPKPPVSATPATKKVVRKEVAQPAQAWLPLARKGEGITSPKILAERIRESLQKHPGGDGSVRGANASPNQFLASVRKAGAPVEGVHALPVYLESLLEREMPSGELTMSRVQYTRDSSANEKHVLDLEHGYKREAHKGERGWYDANTGLLILAGDCTNSPLVPTKGPVAPPPPVVQTPPPVVYTTPAPISCDQSIYAKLNIWAKDAVKVPGVSEEIERTRVSSSSSYYVPSRVSRNFGAKFRSMYANGELQYGSSPHETFISILKKDGTEQVLHHQNITGSFRFPVPESFAEGDVLRVAFTDLSKFISPPVSDIRTAWKEFYRTGCGPTTNIHAIER